MSVVEWLMCSLVLISLFNAAANRVESVCGSRRDCSHNGDCVNGACVCSRGWTSSDCHQLKFSNRSTLELGLNADAHLNISSWGGSVVRGDDGTFHMYAAVMAKQCGLGTYKSNSFVGHATSTDPLHTGFVLQDTAINSYAHEPTVIRAPTGEYVLFFTAAYRPLGSNWSVPVWGDEAAANPGPVDCTVPAAEQKGWRCDATSHKCVNTTGNPQYPSYGQCVQMGCEHTHFPGKYQPGCLSWGCWDDPTYMAYASDPAGPWSTPVIVLDPLPSGIGMISQTTLPFINTHPHSHPHNTFIFTSHTFTHLHTHTTSSPNTHLLIPSFP